MKRRIDHMGTLWQGLSAKRSYELEELVVLGLNRGFPPAEVEWAIPVAVKVGLLTCNPDGTYCKRGARAGGRNGTEIALI